MTPKSPIQGLFFLFLFPFLALAQTNNESAAAVEIPGTELHSLTSKIVGQAYDLYVNLPGGYADSEQTYPTLFLLDAQWDFPLVTAIYGQQYYDGFIPGIVIVGITWGGESPSHGSLRARDFAPVRPPRSSNAPKFLSFIKTELIPFIESKYRVNDEHILMGSSLGGLFTLYALFNEPELFSRYVLTSPALGWDSGIIKKLESEFAAKSRSLPVRLYMAIGGLEPNVSEFQDWAAHLQARNYENFEMQTRILDGIGHSGSKAEGYTRGLQFVFSRPALTLSAETLKPLLGAYQNGSGRQYKVSLDEGRLAVAFPGGKTVLTAASETDFYLPGTFLKVHFDKDNAGKVSGAHVARFDGEESLQKIQ